MNDKRLTDHQFFTSLKKYSPIFYTGTGEPWFLLNEKWYLSFLFITISAIAYAVCIYILHHFHEFKEEPQNSPKRTLALTFINYFMLLGLSITFLMTQFLNPGIKNPDSLTQKQFKEFGTKYCVYCQKNVLEKMQHCKQCGVCMINRDHHCTFFEKCMGGRLQTYAFKFFLLFAFFSCFTLFVTVIFYFV